MASSPRYSLRNFLIISASAFTGTLLGLTCAFVYFKFRRKDLDLVLLNDQILAIRKELEDLKVSVQQLKSSEIQDSINASCKDATVGDGCKKNLQSDEKSVFSSMSQASLEAYFDATASFDSGDDAEASKQVEESNACDGSLTADFKSWLVRILDMTDSLQTKGSDEARANAYQILQANYLKGKASFEYLWRYAMACYLYGQTYLNRDQAKRRSLCLEAQRYAFEALALKEDDADVHKWCALTLGVMNDFVGMKQKIEDGHKFKMHIDRALHLKPDDPVLHHLCGRWCFGVASLSWFERQVATTLFAKPPAATYNDALKCFLEADRLKPGWLENMLHLTKVFLALNDIPSVKKWVVKTRKIKPISVDDHASIQELSAIMSKVR